MMGWLSSGVSTRPPLKEALLKLDWSLSNYSGIPPHVPLPPQQVRLSSASSPPIFCLSVVLSAVPVSRNQTKRRVLDSTWLADGYTFFPSTWDTCENGFDAFGTRNSLKSRIPKRWLLTNLPCRGAAWV